MSPLAKRAEAMFRMLREEREAGRAVSVEDRFTAAFYEFFAEREAAKAIRTPGTTRTVARLKRRMAAAVRTGRLIGDVS